MTVAASRIAWFLPPLTKGSGGLNTVFRNAEALVEHGCTCDFVFPPSAALVTTEEETRVNIANWFDYKHDCKIKLYETTVGPDYDLAIATFWDTAPLVASQKCLNKAYFIQDWEPSFYPISDAYYLAMQSYELGLVPITIGRWLANKVSQASGVSAFFTDFCADLSVYRNKHIEKENAICAIYQPEKPRRTAKILLTALRIVKELNPEIAVYLYGSNADVEYKEFTNLGIISKDDCNNLYNRCKLGISMSTTNPSRIPFEMMAAGLPVVELAGDNTSFDFPEDSICFAKPSPVSLATLINCLINQPDRLASMSKAGISYMQCRPLSLEKDQFTKACELIAKGTEPLAVDRIGFAQKVLPDGSDELERYRAICEADTLETIHLHQPKEANRDCAVVLYDELSRFGEIRVAIWSKLDQSDLQWLFLQPDFGRRKWVAPIMLGNLTERPTKYFIHIYGIELRQVKDDAPKFIAPLEVNLISAYGKSSSSITIKGPSGLLVSLEPSREENTDQFELDDSGERGMDRANSGLLNRLRRVFVAELGRR